MLSAREDAARFRAAVEAARRHRPSVPVELPERGSGSWLRRRSVVSVRPEGSRAQTCLRPGCSHP